MIIGVVITCSVTKSVCLSVFQWFICNCLRRVAERVHWSVHCLTFWSSNATHGTTNWAGCSHLDEHTHPKEKKSKIWRCVHFQYQQKVKLKTEISAPSTSSARPQPLPDRQIETNPFTDPFKVTKKDQIPKAFYKNWRLHSTSLVLEVVLEDTRQMKGWA